MASLVLVLRGIPEKISQRQHALIPIYQNECMNKNTVKISKNLSKFTSSILTKDAERNKTFENNNSNIVGLPASATI